MRKSCHLVLLGVVLFVFIPGAATAATPSDQTESEPQETVIAPAQIKADWLRQDVVRGVPATPTQAKVTPEQDAAGACDGVKDGRWGFHTGQDEKPWWQVDLGRPTPIDQVLVYNRCDFPARAARLMVLLSDDAKTWKQVYQHDGRPFYGHSDNKPLIVQLEAAKARYLRIELPDRGFLHLDEVEIYRTTTGYEQNVALGKPATQSSTSPWSAPARPVIAEAGSYPIAKVIERGLLLAANLRGLGAKIDAEVDTLNQVAERLEKLPADAPDEIKRRLYLRVRWAVRRMALANPLLDFDDLLFVKRQPTTYSHMSDQYLGWWSQPGGGLYVLKDFKSERPELRCLTADLPPGNIIRPDISYDGKRVLFAWCKHYPNLRGEQNKLDKANVPEDAFYHLFEMNLEGTEHRRDAGATLRQLTRGKYNDFDGRYLPGGEIVFLSTRRGQYVQCGKRSGMASLDGAGPESYVRCGGGPSRPVAVYTLHVMDPEGGNLRQISPFENFEWTPSVDHQGRILYARWDYVDRDNMPYLSLWSTMPDGTNVQAVFGNFTHKPHCVFEARAIPNSRKLVFTASAHHSVTAGSLVLLDLNKGSDGSAPMTRLTPEVPFPEIEAWPQTYYVNPYPLSEEHYLVAWSDQPVRREGQQNQAAAVGLYLFDAFGNLNLIYRDPAINCNYPLPIKPRTRPHQIAGTADWDGDQEGTMLLIDVYRGLETIPRGTVRRLRIVGVPAKTHPTMNRPVLGVTRDDPGKFVMGTVPVEADGSAHFRLPSGVAFFMQALDRDGMAVQTMRSAVYVQPGQKHTCIGCHEPHNTAPPNVLPLAAGREPSRIVPGPEGSWPLDFAALVQPVMERLCVGCHRPGAEGAAFDLRAEKAYDSLIDYGTPSLRTHVITRYRQGRSTAGACAAGMNPLWKLLDGGHYDVRLNGEDRDRLITWMDTYGQRVGSFDKQQEQRLRELRRKMAPMLVSE